MVHLLDLVIWDVANYVTFFQIGSPRGAAKASRASSPKTNADLRMKIGWVFRQCSEIIWPLDLPCRMALRRVAILSYHKHPLRSTATHGIVPACGPGRRARRKKGLSLVPDRERRDRNGPKGLGQNRASIPNS